MMVRHSAVRHDPVRTRSQDRPPVAVAQAGRAPSGGPSIRPALSAMSAAPGPLVLQRIQAGLFTPSRPPAGPGLAGAVPTHDAGCSCGACAAPPAPDAGRSLPGGVVVQRMCEMGHPYHSDGPCPFEVGHRPRAPGGSGGFRNIYTTPPTEHTGLDLLHHASQEIEHSRGLGYVGPSHVLHAPTTPIRGSVPTRQSSATASAFQRGTGHSSAREHMAAHGYPVEGLSFHRTHAGAYSNHGPSADTPGNIAAATSSANGMMIPTEHHYPPGFHDLTEIEVEPGTHVAHRVHQAIAHPDAPQTPLFRHTISGFQPSMTTTQWDDRQDWARQHLTRENLNAAHALQQLDPGRWPTMDQVRDQEETERTAEALRGLRHAPVHDDSADADMDTGYDGDVSSMEDDAP